MASDPRQPDDAIMPAGALPYKERDDAIQVAVAPQGTTPATSECHQGIFDSICEWAIATSAALGLGTLIIVFFLNWIHLGSSVPRRTVYGEIMGSTHAELELTAEVLVIALFMAMTGLALGSVLGGAVFLFPRANRQERRFRARPESGQHIYLFCAALSASLIFAVTSYQWLIAPRTTSHWVTTKHVNGHYVAHNIISIEQSKGPTATEVVVITFVVGLFMYCLAALCFPSQTIASRQPPDGAAGEPGALAPGGT